MISLEFENCSKPIEETKSKNIKAINISWINIINNDFKSYNWIDNNKYKNNNHIIIIIIILKIYLGIWIMIIFYMIKIDSNFFIYII